MIPCDLHLCFAAQDNGRQKNEIHNTCPKFAIEIASKPVMQVFDWILLLNSHSVATTLQFSRTFLSLLGHGAGNTSEVTTTKLLGEGYMIDFLDISGCVALINT